MTNAPDDRACERLALVAGDVAGRARSPREFLRLLGHDAAGIRPGLLGIRDLARGGKNELPGTGFRPEFDDGTHGQVRHFAGTAAAAALVGPRLALWLSVHATRDAPDTPDGRLSTLATSFARQLRDGDLAPAEAADWIRRKICA